MIFKALSKSDCEQARLWRNETPESLRTPYGLTEEQQESFYYDVVCDRSAKARYWGIWADVDRLVDDPWNAPYGIEDIRMRIHSNELIGMSGLENIERENGRAEISLILNPNQRGRGYGVDAVSMLLDKGFDELNLNTVWGICYECNPATSFWEREINRYGAFYTLIPNMKYWQGEYWKGLYFSFGREKL